jgi:hypothetical protein
VFEACVDAFPAVDGGVVDLDAALDEEFFDPMSALRSRPARSRRWAGLVEKGRAVTVT